METKPETRHCEVEESGYLTLYMASWKLHDWHRHRKQYVCVLGIVPASHVTLRSLYISDMTSWNLHDCALRGKQYYCKPSTENGISYAHHKQLCVDFIIIDVPRKKTSNMA